MDTSSTDEILREALAHCANKKFGGDTQQALEAVQEGQADACECLCDSLVIHITKYLGQTGESIKAIFEYEPDYAAIHPRAHIGAYRTRRQGVNLVIWVVTKSDSLTDQIGNLGVTLLESQRKLGLAEPQLLTFDFKIVDDKDVQEKRGYGLIVSSKLVRSTQVWSRDGTAEWSPPDETSEKELMPSDRQLGFDLELAPASKVIDQALEIEKTISEIDSPLEHYLMELKVAIIRRIISDQLAYIEVAKRWFTISDLSDIFHRRIGYGRIGGKSAGMLLASRILRDVASQELLDSLHFPESYFLGSDLIYIFMAMNGLMHWNNQKYKPEEHIREEYPRIQEEFRAGKFPPEVIEELQAVLTKIGPKPLIVRSSSQLEDNFGTSFAGKYDSYFCPNQGTAEQNLQALTTAIALTYASTLKPDALLYRRSKGLQDYDERMAVLIQTVQGERFGRYYFPFGAGVAFSRNIYRWSPQIRREDGFARLVWGLGTRAVERVGDDFPRPVALSHPILLPDDSVQAIRRYSQHYIDLIDLEDNDLKTLPVHEVITSKYPLLRMVIQLEQDGYFVTPRMRVSDADIPRMAVTFHELLRRTPFAAHLTHILRLLEEHYHGAVDIEFTVDVPDPLSPEPQVKISLLQCRPQSYLESELRAVLPENLPLEDIVFSTHFIVPQGYLSDIRLILFVKPEGYFALPTTTARSEIGKIISQLNALLEEKSFICVGPGRWGATNQDLGVFVSYADIHNAGALVELAGKGIGPAPEPSLGTHFFQDLMEAQIYPLAIQLDDERSVFRHEFFYDTQNGLLDYVEVDGEMADCLRLIRVASFRPHHHIKLVMDDERGQAVAYLSPDDNEGSN